ncbi:hypothetical protein FISHEDRAFT_58419 [Fistulina hepatica ATCC 64428]|nr:hypothetical protein FISHEDRAFT_58419 [Fistulina hepatica ATCC 64428]
MPTNSDLRREELEEAYQIQGAAKGFAAGMGLVYLAHGTWPAFKRQTLPFKGFLVTIATCTGLILGAEKALLAHEAKRRHEEAVVRRQARVELARRGLVGTETEIAQWKLEQLGAAKNS